jgi:protein-S-isoprenylcysteine O-methyltransferase Ste14
MASVISWTHQLSLEKQTIMMFVNKHEKSLLPKALIITAMTTSLGTTLYLTLVTEKELITWLQPYKITGDPYRNAILLTCFAVYFIRLLFSTLVFFRRKMHWGEAILITSIMPFIFPYMAFIGGHKNQQIGLIEIIGVFLFLIGSYLNSRSEHLRNIWKQKKENAGHVYTEGLFKYAIHINYLGDIILFAGLTLVANSIDLLIVPASMALFFIMILIPLKEMYLEEKYGDEFRDYKSNTKKLIPFIF